MISFMIDSLICNLYDRIIFFYSKTWSSSPVCNVQLGLNTLNQYYVDRYDVI